MLSIFYIHSLIPRSKSLLSPYLMNKEVTAILDNEARLTSMSNAAFSEVDSDRSGSIDQSELHRAMSKFSALMKLPQPTEEQVRTVYLQIDRNGDGRIDKAEFRELVRETLRKMIGWRQPEEPTEDVEELKRREERRTKAKEFRDYVQVSGLRKAFQVIFAEIVSKRVEPGEVFSYSAIRLRQLGQDVQSVLPDYLRPPTQANP